MLIANPVLKRLSFDVLLKLKFSMLLALAFNAQLIASLSVKKTNSFRNTLQMNSSRYRVVDRSSFLQHYLFGASTIIVLPNPATAIEFVPASPSFNRSYQDAVEIVYAQRLAVDNILTVINDGNLEEAGFKILAGGTASANQKTPR